MACWGGVGHVSVDAPYVSVCSALGCARDFGNTHHHHILFWIVSLTQSLCLCQQEWDCENLLRQVSTPWVRTVDGTDGHREEAAQWNTDLCTSLGTSTRIVFPLWGFTLQSFLWRRKQTHGAAGNEASPLQLFPTWRPQLCSQSRRTAGVQRPTWLT